MLEQRPEFQVIGQASDGIEAIEKAERLQPDLILLDIGLPKLNGIRAAEQIRKTAPHSKILFLSQENAPDVIQAALDLGALGYLHKTRTHRDLLPAIKSVLAGKQFVSTGWESRD
jgi:DNA-binding NarL/FixJ family response regulator